jgi:hypothetical protein
MKPFNMTFCRRAALGLLVFAAATPQRVWSQDVRFNRDVRPILSNNCFHCHGPDATHREADLRLDDAQAALADRGGYVALAPGDLEKSDAWQRIISDDPDLVMPPPDSHKELKADEKAVLRAWIEQGAKYEGHWAFIAPEKSPLPKVEDERFRGTPIDRWIYDRLTQLGLEPSPEAAKEILIRRVTFDLTGLPPTSAEIEAFLADDQPGAYERVVDRLLESPHFGERMAVHWLDAARYGDTSVFHADGPRDMWIWRDWVVDAFNNNLSYNQFTVQQIAGDLLPDATWREQVATGFLRNNATTDEGGAIAEEFRVEYAVDRVKTTSMVWLGLSMECAQCHAHKYDPISQEDYYRYFAFFNQASDPGMQTRNGNQAPIVEVPDEEDLQKVPGVEAELAAVANRLKELDAGSEQEYQAWLVEAEKMAKANLPPAGAVSYLKLDEAPDKRITDALNADATGVLEGDARLEEGKLGSALRTTANGYVSLPQQGDWERDQAFSHSLWIWSDKQPSGAPVARMDVEGGHRGYDILIPGQEIEVHLIHKWPENAVKVEAAAELKSKQWHHICVTYDGSSKAAGIKIYLDGKSLEVKPTNDQLSETIRTETPLLLGRRSTGNGFDGRIDEVRLYNRVLSPEEAAQLADANVIGQLLAVAKEERTAEQQNQLRNHFLTQVHEPYRETLQAQTDLQKQLQELRKPLSTVMIMKNQDQPRMTYVLKRGQYDAPDEERPVEPGTPAALPALGVEGQATRLDLARWMTRPDHPLTARVAVNRFWQLVFGTGIVGSTEDFGSQGEWPSHPELLDWLAVDFVEHGWDVKRLLKQMVMSQTYRQTSRVRPELAELDPNNRLLGRGPRYRLSAEMVRDQALSVSGLLVDRQGGPSVKPYQPPGLWSEVSLNPGVKFTKDSGDNQYRRSLYTYWKRSSPPPMMVIFDAPSREKCSVRRSRTNTPLQALVLMNDPQFLEAARGMAERLLHQQQLDDEARMRLAYQWVTARQPNAEVLGVLLEQLETQREYYVTRASAAADFLAHGDSPRDEALDPSEHAAWMVLCSLLLNLDETVTRG